MSPSALLSLGAARHYLWPWFPPELQGMVSKGIGALVMLCLIVAVYRSKPSRTALYVSIWWAWEEAQTAICSFAYMLKPWPLVAGRGICSERIDFDLGAAGLVVVSLLVFKLLPVKVDGFSNGR